MLRTLDYWSAARHNYQCTGGTTLLFKTDGNLQLCVAHAVFLIINRFCLLLNNLLLQQQLDDVLI